MRRIACVVVGVTMFLAAAAHAYDVRVTHTQVQGATQYRVDAAPQPSGAAMSWVIPAPASPDYTKDLTSVVGGLDGTVPYSVTVVAQNTTTTSPTSNAITVAVQDADNDGLITAADLCPTDPRNKCAGPVATDSAGKTLRINASSSTAECSGAKTDCAGNVWAADFGFNTGNSAVCNLGGGAEGCVIGGITKLFGCDTETTEDLFQCERWDNTTAPELTYTFAVPNGRYVVNLLLANSYTGTAAVGQRVFDVYAEGVIKYDDLDPVRAAGGSGIAVVRAIDVTVADGNGLTLEFRHVKDNPAVKALEVLRVGACATNADCNDAKTCTTDTCAGSPLRCVFTPKAAGAACQADTNLCTTDACDGAGACKATPNSAGCDDGLFCSGIDTCGAGTCSVHSGNPCAPRSCDEATDTCPVPPLTCENRWDWNGDGLIDAIDAQGLTAQVSGAVSQPPCVE